jgi:hypothetical protein
MNALFMYLSAWITSGLCSLDSGIEWWICYAYKGIGYKWSVFLKRRGFTGRIVTAAEGRLQVVCLLFI